MKFGLISDIHANLPALDAVLTHAESKKIELIYNLGDSIGYGGFPNQVINSLRSNNIISIKGNYDRKVLRINHNFDKWSNTKNPIKLLAFKWAYDQLSDDNIEFIRSFPEQRSSRIVNKKILFVHGSPVSRKEPIYENTPNSRLAELIKIADSDIIFCGHTHQNMIKKYNNTVFINPGSIGRQHDGDPRASYAIINISKANIKIDFYRIPYNIEMAVQEIYNNGLPEEFALMTLYGRDLNTIKQFMGKSKNSFQI